MSLFVIALPDLADKALFANVWARSKRSKDTSLLLRSSLRLCAVLFAMSCLRVEAPSARVSFEVNLPLGFCIQSIEWLLTFLVVFEECNFACHQKCAEKVFIRCIAANNVEDPDEAKLNHRIPHRFETFKNLSPTWCSHCGHMLAFGRRHKMCTGKLSQLSCDLSRASYLTTSNHFYF